MRRRDPSKRFMGKPCRHGHSGERFTSSRACCVCVGESTARAVAQRTAEQREAERVRTRAWYARTRAARLAYRAQRRAKAKRRTLTLAEMIAFLAIHARMSALAAVELLSDELVVVGPDELQPVEIPYGARLKLLLAASDCHVDARPN